MSSRPTAALCLIGVLLIASPGLADNADAPASETLTEKVIRLETEFADHPDKVDLKFELAQASHYLGIAGDDDAGERAEALLLELTDDRPNDALVTAYYGSARLMAAKRTWAIWKKGKFAEEGILLLNEAVADEPDNLEIRFLRGASTYHLPGFFGQTEQAEGDFAYVVATARAEVETGRLAPPLAAAAFYHQGLILDSRGDQAGAIEAWQIAADLAPQSRASQDAQKEIDKRR